MPTFSLNDIVRIFRLGAKPPKISKSYQPKQGNELRKRIYVHILSASVVTCSSNTAVGCKQTVFSDRCLCPGACEI